MVSHMKTDSAPDLEQLAALMDELFTLSRRLRGIVAEALSELELTIPLADALWQLDPAAPPPTMRQLAAGLRCDPSTVTFLADRLVERGLVEAPTDPSDRRRKMVTLTPKGADTRRRLVAAMTTGSPLASLSGDDQRQLLALLRRASSAAAPDGSPEEKSVAGR